MKKPAISISFNDKNPPDEFHLEAGMSIYIQEGGRVNVAREGHELVRLKGRLPITMEIVEMD